MFPNVVGGAPTRRVKENDNVRNVRPLIRQLIGVDRSSALAVQPLNLIGRARVNDVSYLAYQRRCRPLASADQTQGRLVRCARMTNEVTSYSNLALKVVVLSGSIDAISFLTCCSNRFAVSSVSRQRTGAHVRRRFIMHPIDVAVVVGNAC